MAELLRPHPLVREHDAALAGNLWLRFIDGFPEHDPTPLTGKARVERKIARQALAATVDPRTKHSAIFQPRFERLYAGSFKKEGILESTWGIEMMPFFQYFDAARRGENTALHREGIYGSYLNLLGMLRSHHARARSSNADTVTMGHIRGRATELIAGSLIARMRHPNITLVPSLALQDSFGIAEDNHDYLYIDTFGPEPIVQPAQIKTSLGHIGSNLTYFDSIALIYGELDLHVCPYTTKPCKPATAADCLINKTASYILHEDTDQKTAILDTLASNVLIKLSTWDENKDAWRAAAAEQHKSRQLARKTRTLASY